MQLLPLGLQNLVYPVGRLDIDSNGLMLFTNEGELARRLMHPRFEIKKIYDVWVSGQPEDNALQQLRQGIIINNHKTSPAMVELRQQTPYRTRLQMTLSEGRKREIRLMCAAIKHPVLELTRLAIGPLELGNLPPGQARRLEEAEIKALRIAVGL
jgi:23S rRNA pseudouridine2605 synthase